MERLERRAIGRVAFPSKGVMVLCDTQDVLHITVRDLGPIGVGIDLPAETENLVGREVILVTETLIMYADVVRQDPQQNGDWVAGLAAKKFTKDVLQYLFDSIEMKGKSEKEEK